MLSPKNITTDIANHYVNRLDLGADPFDNNYQSDYFYQGGDRRRMLEQLVHYARFSKQPLLLASEKGSGKKQLLNKLVEQLNPIMDCCRVSANKLDSPASIIGAIAERLDLELNAGQTLPSFLDALCFPLSLGDEPEPVLVV